MTQSRATSILTRDHSRVMVVKQRDRTTTTAFIDYYAHESQTSASPIFLTYNEKTGCRSKPLSNREIALRLLGTGSVAGEFSPEMKAKSIGISEQ